MRTPIASIRSARSRTLFVRDCRACRAKLGVPFLSLGEQPPSNAYLIEIPAVEPRYPLDVYACEACWLVQIDEVARAVNIFAEDYAYFSSYSESWLAHCRAYTDAIVPRLGLDERSLVVEVASNDGYLLQYFMARGIPVLGIEPAASVARVAIAKGIPTEQIFFGSTTRLPRPADLLVANNVLAHNPNIEDFVGGIARSLAPAGVATLEFPHLLRLLEGNQFDTIYHEHYSYLSLASVEPLFAKHGLVVFDVDELSTHGGSLRIYVARDRSVTPAVARVRELEHGLRSMDTYRRFAARVADIKRDLRAILEVAKANGQRVAAYGAPAKGNTLLNYCGIGTDLVAFTVDASPHKQGKLLPGSHIPIHAPAQLAIENPDVVLLLAWNLQDEIVPKLGGRRVLVPIPSPRYL
jgi:SAM-dependent methyltransferase